MVRTGSRVQFPTSAQINLSLIKVSMASKAKRRVKLECTACKQTNYFPNKSKGPKDRLELEKFCPHCKKQVLHKETK